MVGWIRILGTAGTYRRLHGGSTSLTFVLFRDQLYCLPVMAAPQWRYYLCPHFTGMATKVQRDSFEVSQWVSSGVKEEEVMGRSKLLFVSNRFI